MRRRGFTFMALERDKHIAERALLTMDETQLLDLYRSMLLIRRFEEKTAEMYARGKITGFATYTPEKRLSPLARFPLCMTRTTYCRPIESTAIVWPKEHRHA